MKFEPKFVCIFIYKYMKQRGILRKLAEVEPADFPFISVYLNAEPNQHGRDDFNVFLKKQLSEHLDKYEEETPERDSFERDAEKINEYMKKIDASANGVAIYACSGADDFFQTIEFSVPFENDRFFVFDRPHLFPLARLIEQNPMYAVLLADTNSAQIYVYQRGRALEKEEIESPKTNRTEVGGWSQMRYQRHIDNLHMHHAKDVLEELDKIVREDKIKQIILAGNEDVIIPILKENLTKELEEKVIGTLRLDVNTPEKELFGQAEQLIHQNDTLEDKKKIEQFNDQNYDDGLGVAGVEKTLAALENGQVQELYLSANFNEIEYHIDTVKKILKDYAPGEDGEMPNAHEPRLIADLLVRQAIESADNIRFIEDANLLEKFGGVAALLRYRIEGVGKV